MINIGDNISHYTILKELGSGGMGKVYLARDERLEREVVLKILSPNLIQDPRSKERFINEARAASRLNHPNIATIYEVAEDKDHLFISMEYVKGVTLKQKIVAGAIDIDHVFRIAIGIARGLAAAHSEGVTHRDIKPHNIMLTEDGGVKIIDFGLAKIVTKEGLTEDDVLIGTPDYMSPEQILGKEVDVSTDIFSFGSTLFECVTGKVPFNADSNHTIGYKIVHEKIPSLHGLNPNVPGELADVIQKALNKDTGKRYTDGSDLLCGIEKAYETFVRRNDELSSIQEYLGNRPGLSQYMRVIFLRSAVYVTLCIAVFIVGLYYSTRLAVVNWFFSPEYIRGIGIATSIAILIYVVRALIKDSFLARRLFLPEAAVCTIMLVSVFYVTGPSIKDPLSDGEFRRELAIRYNAKGERLHKDGNSTAARNNYQRANDIDPSFAAAWNNLGMTSLAQNELFEARFQIEKAVVLDSSMALYWNNFGLVEMANAAYESAVPRFQRALQLDHAHATTLYNLASCYHSMERFHDAESYYRKAIQTEDNVLPAYNNLGNLLISLGRYDEAQNTLAKGLELDPDNAYLYKNLGVLRRMQNKIDESIAALRKAVSMNGDFVEARLELAISLQANENITECKEQLRYVIQSNISPFQKKAELLLTAYTE